MFWKIIAWLVTRPRIRDYLIRRAQRTPYFHLDGYMNRWWLFNPYNPANHGRKREWLPSIRIHHILREDRGRHLHDHPWNARTIILKGWYYERRLDNWGNVSPFYRSVGDTATLQHDEYHSIDKTSDGGVWTMFITGKFRGTWGFLVDGRKVPHKEYLKQP